MSNYMTRVTRHQKSWYEDQLFWFDQDEETDESNEACLVVAANGISRVFGKARKYNGLGYDEYMALLKKVIYSPYKMIGYEVSNSSDTDEKIFVSAVMLRDYDDPNELFVRVYRTFYRKTFYNDKTGLREGQWHWGQDGTAHCDYSLGTIKEYLLWSGRLLKSRV